MVENAGDVARLVVGLLDPERKIPWLVVAHTPEAPASFLNLDQVSTDVAEVAQVHLVASGGLTHQLADLLPKDVAVYGDAARIYPAGLTMATDPIDVPKYRLDAQNARFAQKQITDELWRRIDIPAFKKERIKRQVTETVTVVKVFAPSVAVVQRKNGTQATVRQEVCFPGVPIQWVLTEGHSVTGTYDEVNKDFIPTGSSMTQAQVVEHYGFESVILGLVKVAERQTGVITIFPGVDLPITRDEISGNPRDLVMDFLDPGDVVPVRLYRNPQGRTALRMNDIDDPEPVLPALPVIDGGQPWLIEGRHVVDENAEPALVASEPEPATQPEPLIPAELPEPSTGSIPVPGPGLTPGLGLAEAPMSPKDRSTYEVYAASLRGQITQLTGELKLRDRDFVQLNADLTSAEDRIRVLEANATELRKKGTAARRQENQKSTTASRRERWRADEEWFNEELRRAWIGRYLPDDRDEFPLDLTRVSYGPSFFDSIWDRQMTEDDLRKSVRVIVDIATGRAARENKHSIHPLREDAGAAAKGLTRDDGSECMRAYIEQNTAQAKRLHFWKVSNGIELSRVGLHDDMRP